MKNLLVFCFTKSLFLAGHVLTPITNKGWSCQNETHVLIEYVLNETYLTKHMFYTRKVILRRTRVFHYFIVLTRAYTVSSIDIPMDVVQIVHVSETYRSIVFKNQVSSAFDGNERNLLYVAALFLFWLFGENIRFIKNLIHTPCKSIFFLKSLLHKYDYHRVIRSKRNFSKY